jgi:predicted amidohydrolase
MKNKIAAIQMTSGKDVDKNLTIAGNLIREAAELGAKLVVLPEMFPVFGEKPQDKFGLCEELGSGVIQDFLSRNAKENNIWIVGGTIPIKHPSSEKIRAACIVYNEKGKQVARYDKIHLFDAQLGGSEMYNESATFQAGDAVVIVDTPLGKIGLSVCFDIRFPDLYHALSEKGAEILVVPAAFTVPTGEAHWELLARARAVESLCYFVGAGQAGKHDNGRETYGHSLIVDPWGKIVAELDGHTTGVIVSTIDLDYLHAQRKKLNLRKS